MMIVALAPHLAETYANVEAVLSELKIHLLGAAFPSARVCVAIDLKMTYIVLGLMGSAARFGCPYCLWSRWAKHSDPEELRSIITLTAESSDLAAKLRNDNRKRDIGENYSSTARPPMQFTRSFDSLLSIPPPIST